MPENVVRAVIVTGVAALAGAATSVSTDATRAAAMTAAMLRFELRLVRVLKVFLRSYRKCSV